MAEDSSSKKFLVSNFMNYKMLDSRLVMEQYNELLHILGQFTQHDMKMDESISVSSIIDKFPPSWKDFKHTLKHKNEDMSLVELGSHIRIEESLRFQELEKGKEKTQASSSVNVVEHDKNLGNFNNSKGDKRKFNADNDYFKKKSKLSCWRCGKLGHLKRDCRVKILDGNASHVAGPSGPNDPKAPPG